MDENKKEEKKKRDLLKQFGSMFKVKCDDVNKEIEKPLGYLDTMNVCMIVPKNKGFKDFLVTNFEVKKGRKVPELKYDDRKGLASTCNYSCEYMKVLLEMCKHYTHVKISVKNDFPMTAETKDFKFILAPWIGGLIENETNRRRTLQDARRRGGETKND